MPVMSAAPDAPDDVPTPERRREQWRAILEGADPAGPAALDRRAFLLRMGAALALSGLGACTRAPKRKILPYVVQPPEVTPGIATRYATAMSIDGYAAGLLVESHEGRPTKVEGNPSHPTSLGATSALEQAAILSLYDPTRLGAVFHAGEPATWSALGAALGRGRWLHEKGRGLHLVLEPVSSPTLADQLDALRARYPAARIHFHSAGSRYGAYESARIAYGRAVERRLDLSAADVIVTLDGDLLGQGPAMQRCARDWADRRRDPGSRAMNRLYAVESSVTATGMAADHRLALRRADIAALAVRLAAEIVPSELPARLETWRHAAPAHEAWIRAVAKDLREHRGRSVIACGDGAPVEVHLVVDAMNAALGNVGPTITVAEPPILDARNGSHDLPDLAHALRAGDVEHLVILGTDLVYSAPADVELASLLRRAKDAFYIGTHADETARACAWMAPLSHALESWGDARAYDGTASLVQPLIAPLRGGRSAIEVLAMLSGTSDPEGYALVRERWKRAWSLSADAFERRWEESLARGIVAGSAFPSTPIAPSWDRLREALARFEPRAAPSNGPLEITFPRDPKMHDGRSFTNAWLLELPDPVTKLTWENAVQLSRATAARLGIDTGDRVELELRGRRISAAALIVPGHPDESIALPAGWGRSADGAGPPHGVNAYRIATAAAWHADLGVLVRKQGERRELPCTQSQHRFPTHEHEHAIYRRTDLTEYRKAPAKIGEKRRLPQLYEPPPPGREGRKERWAMAIDLSICTGCSACVVACQAENNVPTVGREGVLHSRAMHWLRVDTYELAEDGTYAPQPMLCQHCEMAPCEYVCPVNATVHSDDGLNEMVYNRCVGTRFCSNNCPYKVRRFNWFDYHGEEPSLVALARNPDVTVRARGVMEKCTFCVQRIREVEIRTRAEGRPPKESELQTACQQACPTRAIVFGDGADPGSEVAKLHESPRAYGALEEFGTRPRVQYLARVRNRNEGLP